MILAAKISIYKVNTVYKGKIRTIQPLGRLIHPYTGFIRSIKAKYEQELGPRSHQKINANLFAGTFKH